LTRLAGTAAAGTLGAMTPGDTLTRLAADLDAFEDPQERLAFVVDRVRRVPPLPAAERIDANRVTGCISIVWLTGREEGGRWTFRADADSPVVRGLLLLLCEVYTGAETAAIAACTRDPLAELGLLRDLSPTRRNGLASALARLRALAAAEAPSRP
jgi:cysteine desulfuration protein SufE